MHTYKECFAKDHVRLDCAQIPVGASHRIHVTARRRFRSYRAGSTLLYRTVHKIRDPFTSRIVSSLCDHAFLAWRGLRSIYEWNICNEVVSPGLNRVWLRERPGIPACPRRSGENPDRPGRQDNFTVSSSLHGRPPGILLPGAVCCGGTRSATKGPFRLSLARRQTPRGHP